MSTGKKRYDAKTLEKPVETYLKREVETLGGKYLKLPANWYVGIPDRLVILPGRVAFVELKRPKGGRLRVTQKLWKKWLTDLGCECHIIVNHDKVDAFIRGEL